MLSVQVNRNSVIEVTFDVTGGGEDIIGYYIREVRMKLKNSYWNNREEHVKRLKSIQLEMRHCSSSYTESRNERILTFTFQKLNGFYTLALFQPAIELQYNELMKVLRKEIDEENDPVQFEMVLDVIY